MINKDDLKIFNNEDCTEKNISKDITVKKIKGFTVIENHNPNKPSTNIKEGGPKDPIPK